MIIDKYNQRAKKINSLLCVGLDSDFDKLPERFKARKFPQFEFNKWVIEETHEYAAAFKMNSAFFEARGDAGMKELKMTMDYLIKNHPDIFTILDAKRADIGNTNKGYVTAIFDWLGFDAVTLHPYLGKEALKPFLDRADKGAIILCRTSNPGAGEFQDLKVGGKPLYQIVAEKVAKEWNHNGNCAVVVGATYPSELEIVRRIVGEMPILIPGVGAQGGDVEKTVKAGVDKDGLNAIINSSRGIIYAGNGQDFAQKARIEAEKLQRLINQ